MRALAVVLGVLSVLVWAPAAASSPDSPQPELSASSVSALPLGEVATPELVVEVAHSSSGPVIDVSWPHDRRDETSWFGFADYMVEYRQISGPSVPSSMIIGGTPASDADAPWQVQLAFDLYRNGPRQVFCGAVMVSQRHVMTAAHCLESVWWRRVAPIRVVIGQTRVSGANPSYRVQSVRMHPEWDRSLLRNDIAILTLTEPAPDAVVLPMWRDGAGPVASTPVQVAGWGRIDGSTGAKSSDLLLMSGVVAASPGAPCPGRGSQFHAPAHICVVDDAPTASQSACNGDSGGPLTMVHEDEVFVVGLTSWGTRNCPLGHPVAYTRLSTYASWVDSVIAEPVGTSTWVNGYGPESERTIAFVSPGRHAAGTDGFVPVPMLPGATYEVTVTSVNTAWSPTNSEARQYWDSAAQVTFTVPDPPPPPTPTPTPTPPPMPTPPPTTAPRPTVTPMPTPALPDAVRPPVSPQPSGSSEPSAPEVGATDHACDVARPEPDVVCADFDGDGSNDRAEAWERARVGRFARAGVVRVVHGNGGAVSVLSAGDVGSGPRARGALFGSALAAHDIDGDGFDDLIVGAPGLQVGRAQRAGGVAVFSGTASGLVPTALIAQNSPGVRDRPERNDRFGADIDIRILRNRVMVVVEVPGERLRLVASRGAVHQFVVGSDGFATGSTVRNTIRAGAL